MTELSFDEVELIVKDVSYEPASFWTDGERMEIVGGVTYRIDDRPENGVEMAGVTFTARLKDNTGVPPLHVRVSGLEHDNRVWTYVGSTLTYREFASESTAADLLKFFSDNMPSRFKQGQGMVVVFDAASTPCRGDWREGFMLPTAGSVATDNKEVRRLPRRPGGASNSA